MAKRTTPARGGSRVLGRRLLGGHHDASEWLTTVVDADRAHDIHFGITVEAPWPWIGSTSGSEATLPNTVASTTALYGRSGAALALPPADHHDVLLYRTDEESVSRAADFLVGAVARGESILLVASPDHRKPVEAELRRNVGFGGLSYEVLDAAETVDQVLLDGNPDPSRFRAVVGDLVEDLASRGRVSIYGEMVNVLWEQGDAAAAVRLEEYWNELGARLDFTRLCGYRARDSRDGAALDDVCRLHAHVRAPA